VVLNDKGRKLNEDELVEKISDFDGILAGTEVYSKRVLDKAVKLRAISRLGVGMDNIDLEFAKKKKIQVFKTQTTPAPAVAELTLGLILDLLRNISFQCSQLKTGIWKKKMGSLLSGKTLGIIGLGIIGKTLVEISQGFGLKYLAHDVQQDGVFAERYNLKYCSLNELLASSDVVSIHVNLSSETKNIIDIKALGNMKQSAILINTSRGEIVDEFDLKEALDNKLIAGAGLDVYQEEPYNGPLLQYDNIINTPHIGAYAKEIRIQMEREAANNLIRGLNEKK
jgi:D-3-phosphoglycerate dehydrogenase